VRRVALFLEGQQGELEKELARRMRQAARGERFEEAARLRDQLQAVRQVAARQQKVLSIKKAVDQDILALARRGREAAVHLFRVREGKLLSREHFPLSGAGDAPDEEAIGAFIKSYYGRGVRPPAEIVLSHLPGEKELIQEWLRREAGCRVLLVTPRRSSRKELVELALRNGLLKMEEDELRFRRRERLPLSDLARLAGLQGEPSRIEGYDISHLRGDEAVGVMVVFQEGRPAKDLYRHFFLRHTPAGDDCAALGEVLCRRARRRDWPPPDLILIDGGKGQLTAARASLARSGLTAPPLLALAKDPDRIFLETSPEPLLLPAGNPLLQLLQRIRDEAHRFALGYHRRLRLREGARSPLEDIPGIGPKRRAALLEHFGGMDGIYRATIEQLAASPGFNQALARRLFQHLHE
jgi:excinuclease ABC subunit C